MNPASIQPPRDLSARTEVRYRSAPGARTQPAVTSMWVRPYDAGSNLDRDASRGHWWRPRTALGHAGSSYRTHYRPRVDCAWSRSSRRVLACEHHLRCRRYRDL